jgi:hypothetical protein
MGRIKKVAKKVTNEVTNEVANEESIPSAQLSALREYAPAEIEHSTETEQVRPRTFRIRKKYVRIFIVVFFVVAIVSGFFAYRAYTAPEAIASREVKRIEAENKALIIEISKVMLLPQNEIPVIYTIDDPTTLMNKQPFFTASEKGDKLIIYPKSSKAIIYSPSRKVIVNVGPIAPDSKI